MNDPQRFLILAGSVFISLVLHVYFFEWYFFDIGSEVLPTHRVYFGFGVDYEGNKFIGLLLGVILPIVISGAAIFVLESKCGNIGSNYFGLFSGHNLELGCLVGPWFIFVILLIISAVMHFASFDWFSISIVSNGPLPYLGEGKVSGHPDFLVQYVCSIDESSGINRVTNGITIPMYCAGIGFLLMIVPVVLELLIWLIPGDIEPIPSQLSRSKVSEVEPDVEKSGQDQEEDQIPVDSPVWFNIALSLHNDGDYEKAIDQFTELIDFWQEYPDADLWFGRAEAYRAVGALWRSEHNWLRAIEDYTEAIKILPEMAKAYWGRGCAYRELGLLGVDKLLIEVDYAADAEADFKKARELGYEGP